MKQGFIEQAPEIPTSDNKPVIKQAAETTKVHIVFDASAKK